MRQVSIVLLLATGACASTATDPVVLAGDYTFTPDGPGEGSCGPDYAGIYFVTADPTTVTVTPTDGGFDGQDQSRTADGLGALVCEGVTDYTCDLYDGLQAASDIDAVTTALANAEGRWIGETTLDGTWTLSSSCTGEDCGALESTYGATFPCTWTQVYTAARE